MLTKTILFLLLTLNVSLLAQETNPLAFIQTGNKDAGVRIIFIHGSPGDKHAFDAYLDNVELQQQAELIAVDRVGYGDSSIKAEPRLLQQARGVENFLAENKKIF